MIEGIQNIGNYNVYYNSFLSETSIDQDFLYFISNRSCETIPTFCLLNFGITNQGFFEIRGVKINLLKRSLALWLQRNRTDEAAQYLMESDIFLNLIHIDYYDIFVMDWLLLALRRKFNRSIYVEIDIYPVLLTAYILVLFTVTILAFAFIYKRIEKKFLETRMMLTLINYEFIIKNKVLINYLKKKASSKALFNKILR